MLAVLPWLLAGCGEPLPDDPARIPVAWVDGTPLMLSELEDYFAANLLETENEEGQEIENLAEVRSRLFDAFVEERLLLSEAERRKLPVDEREIELYIASGGSADDDANKEPEPARQQAEARRRLMIEKLQEDALRSLPPLGDDEVRAYLARNRSRLEPGRWLELRSLMLESKESADRVYQDVRKRKITFAEAVVRYEKSPGQGLPMRVAWDGLSDKVREALEGLKAGEVSRPVEVNGNVYVFQVASWLEEREDTNRELIRRARLELERERRRQVYDALLAEIRERTPVRLELRNLPFDYVREPAG